MSACSSYFYTTLEEFNVMVSELLNDLDIEYTKNIVWKMVLEPKRRGVSITSIFQKIDSIHLYTVGHLTLYLLYNCSSIIFSSLIKLIS